MVELAAYGFPTEFIYKYKLDSIASLLIDTWLKYFEQQLPPEVERELCLAELHIINGRLILFICLIIPISNLTPEDLAEVELELYLILRQLSSYMSTKLGPNNIAPKYNLEGFYLVINSWSNDIQYQATGYFRIEQSFSIDFVDTSPAARTKFQQLCRYSDNIVELAELAFITLRQHDLQYYYSVPAATTCQLIADKEFTILDLFTQTSFRI